MTRIDGRAPDELRNLVIRPNYLAHPLASVLIECGGTKVICAVSVEAKVPPWMKAQKVPGGWVTCEYGMLPASTHERMRREASSGKQGGRTMEIQRLIGRSLRAVVDLNELGENTASVDCDVIDADGGTRTASITGSAVALALACRSDWGRKHFAGCPLRENVAAVSVGIVGGVPMLDLCYEEDSKAEVDMNVVMTDAGEYVEIQGTGEERPFTGAELTQLLALAEKGCRELHALQKQVIGSLE